MVGEKISLSHKNQYYTKYTAVLNFPNFAVSVLVLNAKYSNEYAQCLLEHYETKIIFGNLQQNYKYFQYFI